MSECIAAHTNPTGKGYPGYINFSREDDGTVSVILRGNPSELMPPPPSKAKHVNEGPTAKLTLSAADFRGLLTNALLKEVLLDERPRA